MLGKYDWQVSNSDVEDYIADNKIEIMTIEDVANAISECVIDRIDCYCEYGTYDNLFESLFGDIDEIPYSDDPYNIVYEAIVAGSDDLDEYKLRQKFNVND